MNAYTLLEFLSKGKFKRIKNLLGSGMKEIQK